MVPLVGLFYPLPVFPVDIFPAIFAAFMLLGGGGCSCSTERVPGTLVDIEASLEAALQETAVPSLRHRGRFARRARTAAAWN